MNKRGFTIIELLVVVAILAILVTLVSAGFQGVFYSSRLNKAFALKQVMQSAFDTYYTRTGEWPKSIQSAADSMQKPEEELDYTATDKAFQEIVKYAIESKKNPLFDYSTLSVALASTVQNGCRDVHGKRQTMIDNGTVSDMSYFTQNTACVSPVDIVKALQSARQGSLNTFAYGYVGPNHQHFCRFRLVYNAKTDRVKVLLQTATENKFRDK